MGAIRLPKRVAVVHHSIFTLAFEVSPGSTVLTLLDRVIDEFESIYGSLYSRDGERIALDLKIKDLDPSVLSDLVFKDSECRVNGFVFPQEECTLVDVFHTLMGVYEEGVTYDAVTLDNDDIMVDIDSIIIIALTLQMQLIDDHGLGLAGHVSRLLDSMRNVGFNHVANVICSYLIDEVRSDLYLYIKYNLGCEAYTADELNTFVSDCVPADVATILECDTFRFICSNIRLTDDEGVDLVSSMCEAELSDEERSMVTEFFSIKTTTIEIPQKPSYLMIAKRMNVS